MSEGSGGPAGREEEREEDRPGLFGRPGYLHHHSLAEGELQGRRGGCHVHRRRAERGPERPGRKGQGLRRVEVPHAGPERGVRTGLPVAHAPLRCHLRGEVPPGHLHCASPAGQGAGGGGTEGRRGRDSPRLHRQGQRPGALRAGLQGPGAAAHRDRPLAAVEHPLPRGGNRLREDTRHRPGQHLEEEHLFAGHERVAHEPRGRRPGGPVEQAAGAAVPAHQVPEGRPRP